MAAPKSARCPRLADLIFYGTGRLAPALEAAITEHLDACAECRGLLKDADQGARPRRSLISPRHAPTSELSPGSQQQLDTKPGPRTPEIQDTRSYADEVAPASADDDRLPEKVGKYFVLSSLGRGGFGKVYLARDPDLDQRLVALKVPRFRGGQTDAAVEDFLRETRTASQLQHPRIVRIYDWGRDAGVGCYVVMQHIEGRSLAGILKSERLELRRLCDIVIDVAEALAFMHAQGHVHRDVKPANMLVGDANVRERAWLSDFGLAFAEDDRWAHGRERAGTPSYMAPEQVSGEAHLYRGQGDVWSLGVVLYEGLTGKRPFAGESVEQLYEDIEKGIPRPPRELNPKVPRTLERLCLQCLQKRPDQRPTMAELASALRRWRLGQRVRRALPMLAPAVCLLAALLLVYVKPTFEKRPDGVRPVAVYSSKFTENNLFRVNESANSLQLVSDTLYLVRLGRIGQEPTAIRLTIKSIGDNGEAGLFIGLQDRDDGRRQFQRIFRSKRPDGSVYSRRQVKIFHIDQPGMESSHEYLTRKLNGALEENRLEVHLGGGQLQKLSWNGVAVSLAEPVGTEDPHPDVTGMFGVFTNKTTAVFSQIVINEQPQILVGPSPNN